MAGDVICIGNLFVDMVMRMSELPAAVERELFDRGYQVEFTHGIAGEALKRLALHQRVHLVSKLGRDDLGDVVLAKLRAKGVNTHFVGRLFNCRTASRFRLRTPKGEVTRVNHRDLNCVVDVEDVLQARALFLDTAEVVIDQNVGDRVLLATKQLTDRYRVPLTLFPKEREVFKSDAADPRDRRPAQDGA